MKNSLRYCYSAKWFELRWFVLTLMVFCGSVVLADAQAPVEAPQRYIVVLEGESTARAFLNGRAAQASAGLQSSRASGMAAAKVRAAQIKTQHDALSGQLTALGAKETGRYHKLLNGMAIKATAAQAEAIRKLPGVKSVRRVQLYEVNTASSVPFMGTTNVWGGTPAADGTGVRIGIIDTGIDYTHADFGGSGIVSDYTLNDHTVIEPGTFPTAKVVGGFDFVGDAYNGASTNTDTPVPDSDPLDCAGHGSHVAGNVQWTVHERDGFFAISNWTGSRAAGAAIRVESFWMLGKHG